MSMQPEQFHSAPSQDELAFGTEPIPAGPYYRADYFELEREAIFKRTWLQIGHLSELAEPGSFIVRALEIANSILVPLQITLYFTAFRDRSHSLYLDAARHGKKHAPRPAGNAHSIPYRTPDIPAKL